LGALQWGSLGPVGKLEPAAAEQQQQKKNQFPAAGCSSCWRALSKEQAQASWRGQTYARQWWPSTQQPQPALNQVWTSSQEAAQCRLECTGRSKYGRECISEVWETWWVVGCPALTWRRVQQVHGLGLSQTCLRA